MENQEMSAVEETAPEKETEESATESKTKNSDSGEEREGKFAENEAVAGETNGKAVAAVGGYSRERPPVDDCCPICFDAFSFPSRTSCGHWFCSSCILLYWRYGEDFKQCKCPICGGLITELVPESSVLIQPGEKIGKILKNIIYINLYNRLNTDRWFGHFLRTLALPLFIRTRPREILNQNMLSCAQRTIRWIGLLLGILYQKYDWNFCPYGVLGVRLLFEFFGFAAAVYLILDSIWYRRRRERHVAQHDALLQIE